MKSYLHVCEFFKITPSSPDFFLGHLALDSRRVQKNDVFCAYQGASSDGYDFIESAIAQGASLILAERELSYKTSVPVLVIPRLKSKLSALAAWFYDQPSLHLKIIGVTGTNGKTSTAHYLAQFLHLLGHKVALLGTVGNGIWSQLYEASHTTLDAISLQRQLYDFLQQGVEYVCMEVSSHALAQNRVGDLQFTSAVFTNLSQDHLDFHGDMQSYAEAKALLFAWPSLKTVVINHDDAYAKLMTKNTALSTRVFYYSLHHSVEPMTCAQHVELTEQGFRFDLVSTFGQAHIKTQLLGEFNVSNLLAAISTLLSLGFALSELAKLSILLQPVKGRMEVLRYPNLPMIVIDYAHTPDALAKALSSLKIYHKPLWVVFGCGGNRDASKRPIMAKVAEDLSDQVIVTEDNSRLEDPEQIFADIFSGFQKASLVQLIPARADAIRYALQHAPRDAIILLAGKGHETYLDTQGQKIYFDERDVIKNFV